MFALTVCKCHNLKRLHPGHAGNSGLRPVAWFRFFSAAESVAATLRLGSGCKVVDLLSPHSYTDLPGGVVPAAAATYEFAVAAWTGASRSNTPCRLLLQGLLIPQL